MSEDQDILFAKAISGTLEGEEVPRWEALCAADPELLEEFKEASQVAAQLRKQVEAMDSGSETRATMPEEVYQRLEADRIAHQKEGDSDDAASDKIVPFFSVFQNHGGLLAAAAAIAFLALGWWAWKGPGGGPVIATIKNLQMDEDLPIVTPGEVTSLTNPPITWMSLDAAPVSVEFFADDGKTLLFSFDEARGTLDWKQLLSTQKTVDPMMLEPGERYLLRLRQGELISEKWIAVSGEARAISDWAGAPVERIESLLKRWAEAGQSADVLALAADLAKAGEAESLDLSEIRKQALSKALAAEKERMNPPKSEK